MTTTGVSDFRLSDIWLAVERHGRSILLFSVLCAAVTTAVTVFWPPRTIIHSALVLGQVNGQVIEDPKDIAVALNASYGLSFRIIKDPGLTRVEVDRGVINFTASSSDPEAGLGLLRSICTQIVQRHKDIADKRLKILSDQREQLVRSLEYLRPLVGEATGGSSIPSPNVVVLTRDAALEQLIAAQRALSDLDAKISDPTNRPTAFANEPFALQHRLSDRVLPPLVALVGGLLLGLAAAVGLAIASRVRCEAEAVRCSHGAAGA